MRQQADTQITIRDSFFHAGPDRFRFVGTFTFPPLTDVLIFWNPGRAKKIDQYLSEIRSLGMKVIRLFPTGPYPSRVGEGPEPNWLGLDRVVERCEHEGIFILWSLWDYWDYGLPQSHLRPYRFWEDPRVLPVIEKTVRLYRSSPAVLGWELINEGDLHTINDLYPELLRWTEATSARIKDLDPDRPVSTGYSGESLREWWFGRRDLYGPVRERYMELHSLPGIDFITFHGYGGPINDMIDATWYGEPWFRQMAWFVEECAAIRSDLGKPVVFEEWGFMRRLGGPLRAYLFDFTLGLLEAFRIDSVFNGWGRDYFFRVLSHPRYWINLVHHPSSMLVHRRDCGEKRALQDSIRRIEKEQL